MMLCMIDAMEGRDLATSDIPGAFQQKDYNKGYVYIYISGGGNVNPTQGYRPGLL